MPVIVAWNNNFLSSALTWMVLCLGDMRSEEAVKLVDKYHQLYIQRLMELYDAHKDLYFSNRLSDLKLAE